jgi:hypothetical protein
MIRLLRYTTVKDTDEGVLRAESQGQRKAYKHETSFRDRARRWQTKRGNSQLQLERVEGDRRGKTLCLWAKSGHVGQSLAEHAQTLRLYRHTG